MEEASAGMLVLAGGGDAERAVLVLVVVDSAAGSGFAVFVHQFSLVFISSLLNVKVPSFFAMVATYGVGL